MPVDDYPGAATKHIWDSETLLDAGRFDGAGYLAGYAVECTIKTILQVEGTRLGCHDLEALSRKALALAVPSGRAARYIKNPNVTTMGYGAPPGWVETMRYQAAGYVEESVARSWVVEARRLYDEVIVEMRLAGELP